MEPAQEGRTAGRMVGHRGIGNLRRKQLQLILTVTPTFEPGRQTKQVVFGSWGPCPHPWWPGGAARGNGLVERTNRGKLGIFITQNHSYSNVDMGS